MAFIYSLYSSFTLSHKGKLLDTTPGRLMLAYKSILERTA